MHRKGTWQIALSLVALCRHEIPAAQSPPESAGQKDRDSESEIGTRDAEVLQPARGGSFFSALVFSSTTYLGRPPSTGGLTSPRINGWA